MFRRELALRPFGYLSVIPFSMKKGRRTSDEHDD
jgi:hypothetical protein